MTGIVIVTSIMKYPEQMVDSAGYTLQGGSLSTQAFNTIPVIEPIVLTVGLITFAWSTILGWSYYGEKCWEYLVGRKAIMPFRIIWTIVVFIGSVTALDVVWRIADILNGLMAWPNCVALLGLSGVIVSETRKYLWNHNMEAFSEDEIRVVEDR